MSAIDTLLTLLASDLREVAIEPTAPGAPGARGAAGLDVAVPELAIIAGGDEGSLGDDDFLSGGPDFLAGGADFLLGGADEGAASGGPAKPGEPARLPTLAEAMPAALPPLALGEGLPEIDDAVRSLEARTVLGSGAFDDVDALGPRGARVLLDWLASAAQRQARADDGGDGALRGDAHGGVGRLFCRALASPDEQLVVAALQIIEALELRALQVAVAELFVVRAGQLEHATVEAALLCLERIGDGRCVRTMEEALARHQDSLTGHQAWRARRIVQRIRRFWRK